MPNTPPLLVAGGTIYPNRFVKMSTTDDFRGLQATANDPLIGVSLDGSKYPPLDDLLADPLAHAVAGDPLGLYGVGDVCLVECGGTVTRGDKLKSDANGKAVSIATSGTTQQHYGAIALESGASGQKIRALVVLGSLYPALS